MLHLQMEVKRDECWCPVNSFLFIQYEATIYVILWFIFRCFFPLHLNLSGNSQMCVTMVILSTVNLTMSITYLRHIDRAVIWIFLDQCQLYSMPLFLSVYIQQEYLQKNWWEHLYLLYYSGIFVIPLVDTKACFRYFHSMKSWNVWECFYHDAILSNQ